MPGLSVVSEDGRFGGWRRLKRSPLGAFLVSRESFMASHDFEKFIEVNDGA